VTTPNAETGRRSWIAAGILALLVAANAAVHVAALHFAPYLDEGDFASSGLWLSRGGLFYVDTWNERGPFVYYLVALLYRIAPPTLDAVRVLGTLLATGEIVLLFFLARRWFGRRAALVAPAFYLVFHPLVMGLFFLPEHVSGVLGMAGLLLLFEPDSRPRYRHLVAGGILLSCMAVDKQSAAVLVLAAGVLLAVRSGRSGGWRRPVLSYSAGVAVPWMIVAVPYAVAGELPSLVWGLLFPLTQYQVGRYAQVAGQIMWPLYGPLFVALVGYSVRLLTRPDRFRWPFLVWAGSSAVLAAPSFFAHHALLLLPPAAVAVAGLAAGLAPARKAAAPAILLAAVLAGSIFGAYRTRDWRRDVYNPANWDEIEQVGAFIRAGVRPDETIWVFPHGSTLYLFSDRRSASRFPFLLPWTASEAVVRELVRDLSGPRAPRFVVYTHHFRDTSPGVHPARFAGPILDRIAARYRLAAVSRNGLLIFERDDAPRTEEDVRKVRRLLESTGPPRAPGVPCLACGPQSASP
jgi:hypothetical protein